MKRVPADEFLLWAGEHGIGVDAECKTWPRNLRFVDREPVRKCWSTFWASGVGKQLVIMLGALGPWQGIYLWPKCTDWLGALLEEDRRIINEPLLRSVLPGDGFEGAYLFGAKERDELIRVMYCAIVSGWTWWMDLYLVPDSGRLIMSNDHGDFIDAVFAAPEDRDSYVAALPDWFAEHDVDSEDDDE